MLNEIKEYEEYTSEIKKNSVVRLQPSHFGKSENGMVKAAGMIRAMTVVARAELERAGYFEPSLEAEDQKKIIQEVKEALGKWSGFAKTSLTIVGSRSIMKKK